MSAQAYSSRRARSLPGTGAELFGGAADIAMGLLLVLAILPVAALAAPLPPPGGRGLAFWLLVGEALATPAFMFLVGFIATSDLGVKDAPVVGRRLASRLALALLAGMVAAGAGILAGQGVFVGLSHATPALRLTLLAAVYALVMRSVSRRSPVLMTAFALLLHVAGVIIGGRFGAALTPAVFFLMGVLMFSRRELFARLVAAEPQLAAASAPFVVALALIIAGRVPVGLPAPGLADIGPTALFVGLAAGPAALAAAQCLARTAAAEIFAALGRAAPLVAIFWLPLFFGMIQIADRGFAPSSASLILFALASLGAVYLVADFIRAAPLIGKLLGLDRQQDAPSTR